MSVFNRVAIVCLTAVATLGASAEQIPAGNWKQTSSNVGDCATCEVKIVRVTPHILQIIGNNGWVGYLHYVQTEDKYRGALQWETGKGGPNENVLFMADAAYEGKTLNLNAKSISLNMAVTYRAK